MKRLTGLLVAVLALAVIHRAIGGAEIDGAIGDLLDARAGTDGLIIELNLGVFLVVLGEPFRIDGIGERGACTVDQKRVIGPNRTTQGLSG